MLPDPALIDGQISAIEDVPQAHGLWHGHQPVEDLSRNEAEFESPAWHQEKLEATEARVKSGQEQFVDWE